MDEYIGVIKMFIGDFAPQEYLICDGRSLAINQYTALYSVIGIRYGGNGSTTFNLPDLRGRFPIGYGQGPGLTPRQLGANGGAETVALTAAQIPAHTHTLNGLSGGLESNSPTGNFLPEYANTAVQFYAKKDKPTDAFLPMNAESIAPNAGGGQAHNNVPPFLTVNFIICVNGLYPVRP